MRETLEQKWHRLMKELTEMSDDYTERQKEADITSDFSSIPALIEQKQKQIREIEEKLKAKRVSTS